MRRVLSFLLALCLIVGLLPAVAMPHAHAAVTTATVTLFGTAVTVDLDDTTADIPEALYWVNGEEGAVPVAAAAEDDWNYSFAIIDGVPTVTIKNANYNVATSFLQARFDGTLKVKYEGTNNFRIAAPKSGMELYFLRYRSVSNSAGKGKLYIEGAEDAVLNVTGGAQYGALIATTANYKEYITISGGTINLTKDVNGGVNPVISAAYCKTTIENCNLTVKNTTTYAPQHSVVSLGYGSSGVTIKNSNVHIEGKAQRVGLVAGVPSGRSILYPAAVTIEGDSNVKIVNNHTGTDTSFAGTGLYATNLTVKGGNVEIEAKQRAVYTTSGNAPALSNYNGYYNMYTAKDGEAANVYTQTTYFKVEKSDEAAHTHTYKIVKTNEVKATCTESGSYLETITCSQCAAPISTQTVTVEATGHTEKTTVETVDATCTTAGSEKTTVTCEKCGEVISETTKEIAALGHTEVEIPAVECTCTETGLTAGKQCTVCEEITVKQEVVSAKGHTEEIIPGKAASCTETGLTDGVKCSVCGDVIAAQEEIAALGHTKGAAVKENEVEADYNTKGSYESVVYCSVCNAELSRETIEIPVKEGAVAEINGTKYGTFAEALNAAKTMTGDVQIDIFDKVTLNTSLSGNFDSIKFVGKDADAEIYLDVQGYITATGKKVAFENLILSKATGGFITNAGFMNVAFGVYDVAEVTYTGCTFANGAYASSGKVTYTDCTFKRSHEKYGLWAYGDAQIIVDECTFADYRGIKMYAEGGAKVTELTVKNTDFSALDNKPAIVLTYGESVVLEGNTYSSTGVFELDLDGAPNGTSVTSADPINCTNDNGACGVLVDGKIYTTVAQAAAAATEGSTVTLLHESAESVELPEGVILDKNGFTAAGVTVCQPKVYVAEVDGVQYEDLQEAIVAACPSGTVKLLADVTVDEWVMITQSLTIGTNQLITVDKIDGLTIDGDGHKLTVKDIESAQNGARLFYDADNLNIQDLTIEYVDAASNIGGIGLTSGNISNVTIIGGVGVFPGTGNVNITGCTFKTAGSAIYFEEDRDNLVVEGNTFDTADSAYAIILRGNATFKNNEVITGKVNVANSATGEISGNDFNDVRFKVYNGAKATITENTINNLVFNDASSTQSTFADNILSDEAQAALEAVKNFVRDEQTKTAVVYNAIGLREFAAAVNGGETFQGWTIKLAADIDLNNEPWTPIGTATNVFCGMFDGQENTISNLLIEGSTTYISGGNNDNYKGLFGYMKGGNTAGIKNLTIENAKVTGCLYVGVVLGRSYTGGIIENCHVKGSIQVDSYAYTGGIVGRHDYSANANHEAIKNCSVDGAVLTRSESYINAEYAVSYVGGIVGFMGEGKYIIDNCSAKNIKVSGVYGVGGISGIGHYGNEITNAAVDSVSVVSTGNDKESDRTNNVGLIAGAVQGTASQPTVITGNVTNTTGTVTYTDNSTKEVKALFGNAMTGEDPVTNWKIKIGEVYYETLADAAANAVAGDEIVLLADATVQAGETIVLNGVSLTAGEGITLTNSGTIEVYGQVTLNISTLAGNSIDLMEGAIITDSTVGGAGYVSGNVLFRGNNSFTMLTDYGDYYSKTTPSMWTVEKGGSLTLTKYDRYGLGYGDKVTVYGSIEDALTARGELTDADASLNLYGGLVGMTNSAHMDAQNVLVIEDAYVIFGVQGDKSFGNKSGSYYGNYDIQIKNSVMTANGFKFYEDKGQTVLVMTDTDLLVNGVLMTNDANSTFTFNNCVILSKATNNGTDDKNQNAGVLTLVGTTMTYNAKFTNIGEVVLDINSLLTAPSIAGAGKITVDVTGFDGNTVQVIKADLSEFTGTIELVGGKAAYEITDTGLTIFKKGLEGSGTAADPYLITDLDDLTLFRDSVNAGETEYNASGVYVALSADIDLDNIEWAPIGTSGAKFKGIFDGGNKIISNLKITHPGDQTVVNGVGLFGYTNGATIKNLTVHNANVTGSGSVAAVVGNFFTGKMENVHLTGNIQIAAYQYVGGLIGWGYANVNNCSVTGDGVATSVIKKVAKSEIYGSGTNGYVGGVCGWIGEGNSVINGCSVKDVTITTNDDTVGGICGIFHYGNTFTDCALDTVAIIAPDNDGYNGIIAGDIRTSAGSKNTYSVTVNNVTATADGVQLPALGNGSGCAADTSNGNVLSGTVYNKADAVAKIGNTYYASLADAIAAGGEVTLLKDVVLEDTLTIAADKTVVLNLNGYTISQEKACTGNYNMILNKGNLTITGNGKISFTDTGAGDASFGWGSYTIRNEGNLVVENGTIENLSNQNGAGSVKHMYCAIFQYCGSSTINGGTISTPTYRSVRLWKGDMTINGGNFEGQVWIQAVDSTAKMTIAGGSFAPRGVDGSSVFVGNIDSNGKLHSVDFKVTGGTFTTKIGANDVASLNGPITGGTFTAAAMQKTNAGLINTEYEFVENADGTYGVELHVHTEEIIPGKAATCTESGLTDGKKCTVCGEITVAQEIIEAKGHTEEMIPAVDATCGATGLTAGTKCSVCGEILSAQEEIPATGEHVFDNAGDATCNNCDYTRVVEPTFIMDENNKLVVVDPVTEHIYHRVVVYYLGDETVSDITKASQLKLIDPSAKTYWGLDDINRVVLENDGNYVVHLHYNTKGSPKYTVAKAFTVENNSAPTIDVDNGKITVTDENSDNIYHRATVFYLGAETVTNIYDVNTLKALDPNAKIVWGLDDINELAFTKSGNYVVHVYYNTEGSPKYTVAKEFTVTASKPTVKRDGYTLVVTDKDLTHKNHRATVYFIGESDVDIYDEAALKALDPTAKTYWGLEKINKVQMAKPGKYVVYLHYNLENGAKQTMVMKCTITLPVPEVWLEENGQIGTIVPVEVVHRNYVIYYLGDQTVEDIRDIDALNAIDPDPIKFDNQKQIAERGVLTEKGNYVLVMYYNYSGSVRQYIAEFATLK